jgi:hypothetical protein
MKVLEYLTSIFRNEATKYVFAEIPSARVTHPSGVAGTSDSIEAGKHYFRFVLAEMFLKNDRDWFSNWYPAVHSVLNLKFGDSTETFTHVAGESLLSEVKSHLDRVVSLEHHLTPLLPFNGGTVEFEAGLLAMQGDQTLKAFLDVLGKFSEKLMIPTVSSALNFAEPLADAFLSMVQATKGGLKVGLHQTWSGPAVGAGNPFRSGYLAVVFADSTKFLGSNLAVVKGRLHYGAPGGPTVPLTGYDYMLIRVERVEDRDDALEFSYIKTPFEAAKSALAEGETERAKLELGRARSAALKAKDLTVAARKKAYALLQQEFDELSGGGAGVSREPRTAKELWAAPVDENLAAEAEGKIA